MRKRWKWSYADCPDYIEGKNRPCSRCRLVKPFNEFFKDRSSRFGRRSECKLCKRLAADPDTPRRHRLKKLFGLTMAQYDEMFEAQNGRCAICHELETGRSGRLRTLRRMAVDHDHMTMKIRGLLCHLCNAAIGLLREDPVLFDAAKEYLRIHGHNR